MFLENCYKIAHILQLLQIYRWDFWLLLVFKKTCKFVLALQLILSYISKCLLRVFIFIKHKNNIFFVFFKVLIILAFSLNVSGVLNIRLIDLRCFGWSCNLLFLINPGNLSRAWLHFQACELSFCKRLSGFNVLS